MEQWKAITGYEGLYEISNHGNVKSLQREYSVIKKGREVIIPVRERILRNSKTRKGYPQIVLCKNGKPKSIEIHRLIGFAFIENTNNYTCMNHKDGNPMNNHVSNLEWCTQSYNIKHAHDNGLIKTQHSEKNSQAKLTNADVREIRRLFEQENMKVANISRLYPQVTANTISVITRYKKWKHV